MSRPRVRLTLREARNEAGLSREKVAALVGVSSKTIERMEQTNAAKRHLVVRLADVYGVEVDRIKFTPRAAREEAGVA